MSDAVWRTFDGTPLPIDKAFASKNQFGQVDNSQFSRDATAAGVFAKEQKLINQERFTERTSDGIQSETVIQRLPEERGLSETGPADDSEH